MKKALLLGVLSLVVASAGHTACEMTLGYDQRLDFGARTRVEQNCPPGQHDDPIAEKIKRYESSYTTLMNAKSEPALRSSVALIVDETTGDVLYAKNADAVAPIASITKVMTAMVVLDAGLPLEERITITSEDIDRVKGTTSRLRIGATLTRRELLHLALMSSENRAASALARAYPGGTRAFVAAMNRKASRLGMSNTHFTDPTGLRSDNRSTAEDLARMVRAAHTYPLITELTTSSAYALQVPVVKHTNKSAEARTVAYRVLPFRNTNQLVREREWEIGLSKTGYISEAGHCLVMQAKIAGQSLIIVLLDAAGKYIRLDDAQRIRKWIESAVPRREGIG